MQGALGQGGLAGTPPGYDSVLAGSPDISQIMSSLRLSEPGALGETCSIWRRLPYLAWLALSGINFYIQCVVFLGRDASCCTAPPAGGLGGAVGRLDSAGLLGSFRAGARPRVGAWSAASSTAWAALLVWARALECWAAAVAAQGALPAVQAGCRAYRAACRAPAAAAACTSAARPLAVRCTRSAAAQPCAVSAAPGAAGY